VCVQLRLIIADADLTLKCPRCPHGLASYNGCNCLRCETCGCAFCGLCLIDCGSDAHVHYGAKHGDNPYDRPLFERTHAVRAQRELLLAFVFSLPMLISKTLCSTLSLEICAISTFPSTMCARRQGWRIWVMPPAEAAALNVKGTWDCPTCTYSNHQHDFECEMCAAAQGRPFAGEFYASA